MTAVGTRVAENPYRTAVAGRPGTYHGLLEGRFRRLRPCVGTADVATARVHDSFRNMVLADTYTCVLARSAFRRGYYRFGHYSSLGTAGASTPLAHDLWEFVHEFPIRDDRFATFVATFEAGPLLSEPEFETLLWQQLQHLHELDHEHSTWDPSVSADPAERGFSFSFAQRAFFIVGMHSGSSRFARRSTSPTLVFNAHAQFDILRDAEQMSRMQQVNRVRDIRWQGSSNPSLGRFEREPETIMYSGRLVEPDWTCPLHVRARTGADSSDVRSR